MATYLQPPERMLKFCHFLWLRPTLPESPLHADWKQCLLVWDGVMHPPSASCIWCGMVPCPRTTSPPRNNSERDILCTLTAIKINSTQYTNDGPWLCQSTVSNRINVWHIESLSIRISLFSPFPPSERTVLSTAPCSVQYRDRMEGSGGICPWGGVGYN